MIELDRDDRRAAWIVFAVLLALFTATMCGLPDNPDAEVEFQTTSALARRGTFALGGTPEADAIVARHFNVVEHGGHTYSWYGVGQAIAALPLYELGALLARAWPEVERQHAATSSYGHGRSEYFAHLCVGWRNPLLSALTAMMVATTLLRLGARRSIAVWAALSYGVASFAWAQARSTLSDVQATFFLFAAFALMVKARDRRRVSDVAWLGACIGSAVLTRVATAPSALAIAVVAWWTCAGNDRRRAAALAVPLLVCAGLFEWTNWARFGDGLETGYGAALASGTFFSYPIHLGLAGLLVAPGKGLAWLAPLSLLAPFGLRTLRERGGWSLVITVVLVALATTIPVAMTQTWHGAYTYGPRYLLPLLPLAWIAAALAVERASDGVLLPIAAGVLTVLGVVTNLPAALVDPMTHQDLAVQAARLAWPTPGGATPREEDEARFLLIQWDWRFAAPWAHWRIFMHRLRRGDEPIGVRALFFLDSDVRLDVGEERERGFRHLAWVDLAQRLKH